MAKKTTRRASAKRRPKKKTRGQGKSLVLNHLENISRTTVEKHLDDLLLHVQGRHGIYALYRDDRLYYVGLATSLGRRLRQHLKDRHANSWDRFSVYVTSKSEHVRELEALAHRIVRPEGNKQYGKLVGSTDLRRILSRQIKERADQERSLLFGDRVRARRTPSTTARRPRRKSVRVARASVRRSKAIGRRGRAPSTFGKRTAIRGTHDGVEYRAALLVDGSVSCKGERYTSVSSAARAIVGRRINGRWFWRAKDPNGDWVRLREFDA